MLKEIISKVVPMNEAQLLLLVLTPDSTADKSLDQMTQLSPEFAGRSANELRHEDKSLENAQNFVGTMPLSEDTQRCVNNMQKIRDNLKKEINQRDKENILPNFSPNQMHDLRSTQSAQAVSQKYNVNPMAAGYPRRAPGPSNTVPDSGATPPLSPGNCGPGIVCTMGPVF